MQNYVNLHCHSREGSLLDSYGSLDSYFKRASELGQPALSITDHGTLFGLITAYEAGQKYEVKFIPGMEAYQAQKTRWDRDEEERSGKAADGQDKRGPYHLTVLAQNNQGYRNLIKLSSQAYLQGFYVKARLDYELLSEYSEGLIILSGCLSGEVSRALLRGDKEFALKSAAKMQEVVGKENYFIEVMNHGIEDQKRILDDLIEIAAKIKAPIVPTCDSHYCYQENAGPHDRMLCVSTAANIEDPNRFKFQNDQFYLKSYEEMERLFDAAWLKNTLDIAERVDVKLTFGEFYFPEYPLPPGETNNSLLRRLVTEGIRKRYGANPSLEVTDRIDYEMRVVQEMGFQSYFLVVGDLVNWAKDSGIRIGPSRGSIAGSLVGYVMRITEIDSLKFKLPFERFLISGRVSPPDIDLDIDERYRDKVIDYVRRKYGEDRVANIATFSTIGARAAIRDSARILGFSYEDGDKVAKTVPPAVQGFSKSLDECFDFPEFKNLYETKETSRKIIDVAKELEGLIRQSGIHAAGTVIARSDITDYVPVMRKGEEAPVVTQWAMEQVEQVGLLKIDFLGLRNLSIIDKCLENVEERHGIKIDLNDISLEDKSVYESISTGNNVGLFQIDGGRGFQQLTMAMRPDSMEDLMAILALYRPGPLGSGMDKQYVERKHGKEPIEYMHPKLADVLSDTYGIMLYQESLLAVAQHVAGFTAAEADDLRKACGKKIKEKMASIRSSFVKGCIETSNLSKTVAEKLFSEIEFFGSYGFSRNHSCGYSLILYQTAHLKYYFPVEYMAALLGSVTDDPDRTARYLNECRRMGIKVHPPSIHQSQKDFKVLNDNEILFGLESIAGLGDAASDAIIRGRQEEPFRNVYDFMRRTDPEVLNTRTLEHLAKSGALDELAPEQEERRLAQKEKKELLAIEKEKLGTYVSDHPLVGLKKYLAQYSTHSLEDMHYEENGKYITVSGILSKLTKKITKRGDPMYILLMEDLTGTAEGVIFPGVAKRIKDLEEGEIYSFEGKVNRSSQDENYMTNLIINKVFWITLD